MTTTPTIIEQGATTIISIRDLRAIDVKRDRVRGAGNRSGVLYTGPTCTMILNVLRNVMEETTGLRRKKLKKLKMHRQRRLLLHESQGNQVGRGIPTGTTTTEHMWHKQTGAVRLKKQSWKAIAGISDFEDWTYPDGHWQVCA